MMNELLKDLQEEPPADEAALRSLLQEHGYDLVMASGEETEDYQEEEEEEEDTSGPIFDKKKSPRAQLAVFRIEAARKANGEA
jgi:CO dehydrogenase/acetyl-CoA synthase beta subunit